MSALSAVYGGVARLRRSWYERRPAARARLPRPVISVGNLVVGGSGKTPVVAALAAVLTRLGHRPAILSRGYGRTSRSADVVDRHRRNGSRSCRWRSPVTNRRCWLATIAGVPIVVCCRPRPRRPRRHRAVQSTALILDDGFQHLQLERTIDLLVLSSADLSEELLPSGRLREPLSAARAADAVLVYGDADEARVADSLARSACHAFFFVTSRASVRIAIASGGPRVATAGRSACRCGGRHRASAAFLRRVAARRPRASSARSCSPIITGSPPRTCARSSGRHGSLALWPS